MNHILLYGSYEEAFSCIPDVQVGRLIKAMLHYLNTGEENIPKGRERFLWPLLLDQVQRNMEKYELICERNRNNAQKYWDSHKNVNNDASGTQRE